MDVVYMDASTEGRPLRGYEVTYADRLVGKVLVSFAAWSEV
jgi:hypothetical protein